MKTLCLNGTWSFYRAGLKKSYPAQVPGCIHTDLLSAGVIDNPYWRDNESTLQWIGETDWTYSRSFRVDHTLARSKRILLRCEGLDTLASIRLNGKLVGETDNMFRTWEFDITRTVRQGNNKIEITFRSTLPYIKKRQHERPLHGWLYPAAGHVRKEPCNYGWDWGPKFITCGIWRDISIVAIDPARISDIHITQQHGRRDSVKLSVAIEIEKTGTPDLTARVAVTCGGKTVANIYSAVSAKKRTFNLAIRNPKLWWPAGMGEQSLYDISVELLDKSRAVIDTRTMRIGLRILRCERTQDAWGESFCFSANGVRFFAKGANWIPADTFITRVSAADCRRLLTDAASANMNMVRVWGGGVYESDDFYDICNELGLCVWHDFMFACNTYPAFDSGFMANVKNEIVDNVRRLRRHPCIALWCGNNELEQGLVGPEWDATHMGWDDYKRLFDTLVPRQLALLDPDRDYWPSSPHTPSGNRTDFNSPASGDAHLWSVWHGREPFEWYLGQTHRFVSEMGFQSFPEPSTVASYTETADRNISSYIMEFHQRSGIGNATIIHYMLSWFRLPTSFDMLMWTSQILQALAMKAAVEHFRGIMPRCMGTIYWQLNDCWPVASWSSIDSLGRWKALHFAAKRFYGPVLATGVFNESTATADITVISDLASSEKARLQWQITDLDGKLAAQGQSKLDLAPRTSACAETISVQKLLEKHGPRNIILWIDLQTAGRHVSHNCVFFARPKHMELRQPRIRTKIRNIKDGTFQVRLESDKPALWVWLAHRAGAISCSDNFFHLRPGISETITVRSEKTMTLMDFRAGLIVRSLVDTYAEARTPGR